MHTEQVRDYSRSFAVNTSARYGNEFNSCRTQLLATCSLIDEADNNREFFLGKECIGEYMYQESGIAQVPTAEVCSIFSSQDSSLLKKFANHADDIVQAGEMAVARKGFDGSYANWTSLDFVQKWRTARRLESVEAIIEATLEGEPMVGRTIVTTQNGREAVLEYPIPYMNVHPLDRRFQVDVGPILFPQTNFTTTWMVERMQLAYVMFNELNSAEFALRVPTRVVAKKPEETLHYSHIIKMKATHQLFGLGE